MENTEPLALDYFTGGVPAGTIFLGDINQLRKLVNASEISEGRLNITAEVCFVGLISYFEGFCKNHFASILNICPELILNLKEAGVDDSINASDLLKLKDHLRYKLGFLISERYDFGSSKKINSIYSKALNICPFSKDEMRRFDRFLNERNLIVHHGGIFTIRYSDQVFEKIPFDRVLNSLVIGKQYFFKVADFLENIADKTVKFSQRSLKSFIESNKIIKTGEQKEAIKLLGYLDVNE